MIKKGTTHTGLHTLPRDMKKVLTKHLPAHTAWQDITPLARNEWICWITSAKKPETRVRRIERAHTDLSSGKRRPCCWAGCPHR